MDPMSKTQTDELSRPQRRNWISAIVLGLGLAAVYAANGRSLGSYDTAPTTMMLLTLARGEGVYLDRFRLPRGIRIASYVLIAVQHVATAIVLALGIFDLWGNFRRSTAGPANVRFGADGE